MHASVPPRGDDHRQPGKNPASAVSQPPLPSSEEPLLRVMSLHALLYCERLFFLEEVEEIRVADHAVYAGRRLHDKVTSLDDETPEHRSWELQSDAWGLLGKVDAVRRRDGHWVVYEHKRGRCRRGPNGEPQAWDSDRIQAIAYAVLLEEELGQTVPQARIRYHADNVTAFVDIDEQARFDLRDVVQRARALRASLERPPVAENENLCRRCSLNVVCLPEEERLLDDSCSPPPALFPSDRQRQTIHVTCPRTQIKRSGESLIVENEDGKQRLPIAEVDSLVIHGSGQITTQAIHLCAYHGVAVQWLTAGGRFVAGTTASPGRVHQRIRQYKALCNQDTCLDLARRLVLAKVQGQIGYLLRATRGNTTARQQCAFAIEQIRFLLKKVPHAANRHSLLGLEGMAAKLYFACIPYLLGPQVPETLRANGRTKHPPRDRFNCLLSFGYALLHGLVHRSIVAVGLEPAFGFYHQPRTAAPPLVLDLVELFRTSIWEMALIASLNRNQWNPQEDFQVRPGHVWLSDAGRRKALALFEQRLCESYKHPATGRSLTYARIVELEVRLLEKEWTGSPGLFARLRLR